MQKNEILENKFILQFWRKNVDAQLGVSRAFAKFLASDAEI